MSWREGPVVFVAGLRGEVADHWQSRLARQLPRAIEVDSFGRDQTDLGGRVEDLQQVLTSLDEPATIVAHSAGVLVTVHWAQRYGAGTQVRSALLATPPVLSRPLPAAYPTLAELAETGWLPLPRRPLPFPSIVAASSDDELGDRDEVGLLAEAWGSAVADLGPVGHLNPASGFGAWPGARGLLDRLGEPVATR